MTDGKRIGIWFKHKHGKGLQTDSERSSDGEDDSGVASPDDGMPRAAVVPPGAGTTQEGRGLRRRGIFGNVLRRRRRREAKPTYVDILNEEVVEMDQMEAFNEERYLNDSYTDFIIASRKAASSRNLLGDSVRNISDAFSASVRF